MNVDTDTQWAYWEGLLNFYKAAFKKQLDIFCADVKPGPRWRSAQPALLRVLRFRHLALARPAAGALAASWAVGARRSAYCGGGTSLCSSVGGYGTTPAALLPCGSHRTGPAAGSCHERSLYALSAQGCWPGSFGIRPVFCQRQAQLGQVQESELRLRACRELLGSEPLAQLVRRLQSRARGPCALEDCRRMRALLDSGDELMALGVDSPPEARPSRVTTRVNSPLSDWNVWWPSLNSVWDMSDARFVVRPMFLA
ncbi:unnamed protein product [Polarella glacialis]|uniref:Uncharacterized protein n=1 Tax=Polarella glacialis TaxID=89957 RepID=A0A813G3B1_POLGL|nr:unnamed protein product [Polarella glacialis]